MVENAAAGADSAGDGVKGSSASRLGRVGGISINWILFAAALVAIVAVALLLRGSMLHYQGMFEPDGFYYYSVVRETVSNNFIVPAYTALSGFPVHNARGEQPGLIYLTVLPYMLLQYLGISYLDIMRLLPIVFGLLYIALTYFIVKYISDSKVFGLLAMALVAISSGNVARTAALVYRGDSFVALPLLVAILFMLRLLTVTDGKHRIRDVLGFAIALSTGILVWSGSGYIMAVIMLSLLLLIGYGFVTARKELAEANIMLTGGLMLAYLLEHLYVYIGITRGVSQLYGLDFLLLYVPILLASLLALYLIRIKDGYAILRSVKGRATVTLAIALVAGVIAFFPINAYVISNISGGNTGTGSIGMTTQELQSPTLPFLFASFNFQMYLIFAGLVGFVLFADRFGNKDNLRIKFLTLNMNVGFIVVLSYLVVTGYMQSLAIRYNATVSIPVAIFAALGLYTAWALMRDKVFENIHAVMGAVAGVVISLALLYLVIPSIGTPQELTILLAGAALSIAILAYVWQRERFNAAKNKTNVNYTYIAAAALAAVVCMLLIWITGNLSNMRAVFGVIGFSSVLIVALLEYCTVYSIYACIRGKFRLRYLCIGLIMALLAFNFYSSAIASVTSSPADGVNNEFLSAMTWMSKNTPANATAIEVWPDGSVVEAWGNRTSYTDSVGGENGPRILNFSKFLFNTSPDTGFLYNADRPTYLIARSFWYQELGGLAIEGEVQNASAYGFVTLGSLEITHNATAQYYKFQASNPLYCVDTVGNRGNCDSRHQTPAYYKAMVVINAQQNSSNSGISGYLGTTDNAGYALIKYVMFYNQADHSYSVLQATSNAVSNYTLMITYYNRTITGGAILGTSLPASNLFKFTFLCNYDSCPYGDNSVSMKAVFINNDTRILKISYS